MFELSFLLFLEFNMLVYDFTCFDGIEINDCLGVDVLTYNFSYSHFLFSKFQ